MERLNKGVEAAFSVGALIAAAGLIFLRWATDPEERKRRKPKESPWAKA